MNKIILYVFVVSLFVVNVSACRMYATIGGVSVEDMNLFKQLGASKIGGWGIAAYSDNVTFYRGAMSANLDNNFNIAVNKSLNSKILLSHVRTCTSGCCSHGTFTVSDPHPFYKTMNNKTYTFQHNGGLSKDRMFRLIDTSFYNTYPPTGSGVLQCNPIKWIYQENANTTCSDAGCDGNWGTSTTRTFNSVTYMNYTKLANSCGAMLQVKTSDYDKGVFTQNLSIPETCYNYDRNKIMLQNLIGSGGNGYWGCLGTLIGDNGIPRDFSYEIGMNFAGNTVYEDGMYFKIENKALIVDSELYFEFIMQKIKENDFDTLKGIREAVNIILNDGETGSINFIMSDGEKIYGFKKGNSLYYSSNRIASQPLPGAWISMNDYQLVTIGNKVTVEDIRLDVSYDSASIGAYTFAGNNLTFDLKVDPIKYNDNKSWFNFKLNGVKNKMINFKIINNIENSWFDSVPTYPMYTCDGINYVRIKTISWDDVNNVFKFSTTFPCNNPKVLNNYQFSYTDLLYYISKLNDVGIRNNENVYAIDLHNDSRIKIVQIAGQHASENFGPLYLASMISFLDSDNKTAQRLKNKFRFVFIPLINVDGRRIGYNRADINGTDINRQWSNGSNSKQVVRAKSLIEGADMFIDWHGTNSNNNQFYVEMFNTGYKNYNLQTKMLNILKNNTKVQGANYIGIDKRMAASYYTTIATNLSFTAEPPQHNVDYSLDVIKKDAINFLLAIDKFYTTTTTTTTTSVTTTTRHAPLFDVKLQWPTEIDQNPYTKGNTIYYMLIVEQILNGTASIPSVMFSWNDTGKYVNDSIIDLGCMTYEAGSGCGTTIPKTITASKGEICGLGYGWDEIGNMKKSNKLCFNVTTTTTSTTTTTTTTTTIPKTLKVANCNSTCNNKAFDGNWSTYENGIDCTIECQKISNDSEWVLKNGINTTIIKLPEYVLRSFNNKVKLKVWYYPQELIYIYYGYCYFDENKDGIINNVNDCDTWGILSSTSVTSKFYEQQLNYYTNENLDKPTILVKPLNSVGAIISVLYANGTTVKVDYPNVCWGTEKNITFFHQDNSYWACKRSTSDYPPFTYCDKVCDYRVEWKYPIVYKYDFNGTFVGTSSNLKFVNNTGLFNNSYAIVAPPLNLSKGFDISAKVKWNKLSHSYLVYKENSILLQNYYTSGITYFQCGIFTPSWNPQISIPGATLNKWYTLRCVYDNKNLTLYVNGVKMKSVAVNKNVIENGKSFIIGNKIDKSRTLYGNIDWVEMK